MISFAFSYGEADSVQARRHKVVGVNSTTNEERFRVQSSGSMAGKAKERTSMWRKYTSLVSQYQTAMEVDTMTASPLSLERIL